MIIRPLNKVQQYLESDDMQVEYFISRPIKIKNKLEQLY